MIAIDVVCPVYRNVEEVASLLDSLRKQTFVSIDKIVCPFTLCGLSEIDDAMRNLLIKNEVIFFELDKEQFSHSLTREKAILQYCSCENVVLISQDVKLIDPNSFFNLVSKLDDDIVYVYGKQVCSNKSIESYIRAKNYPDRSLIVSSGDIERQQLMAFFASDAFAALKRNIFLAVGGYNGYNVMMNEDQLYSKIVLDSGYRKMYVANAVVEHSHKYSLKQLWQRYYDTGFFYSKIKIFDAYKTSNSGFGLALYVLKRALLDFNIKVLLRWLPDMASRYFGFRKGRRDGKKST